MKKIVCEMCEGTDFLKQEGTFECQSCGMKYSAEEAKKLMVEIADKAPKKSPKKKQSDELDKLYQLARRAKDSNNCENAAKYYNMILVKDPESWEANFFAIYYTSIGCTIAQICPAIEKVGNCIDDTLKLIKKNVKNEKERAAALAEVVDKTTHISDLMENASSNHYKEIEASFSDTSIKRRYLSDHLAVVIASSVTRANVYEGIITMFADDEYYMLKHGIKALRAFMKDRNEWKHAAKANKVIKKYEAIQKERKAKQEQEKREAYWKEHAEEKAALDEELHMIENKLATLNKQIKEISKEVDPQIANLEAEKTKTLPEEAEYQKQKRLVSELEETYGNLGLFKGKQKKEIKERLTTIEHPKQESLRQKSLASKKEHLLKIDQQILALKERGSEQKAEVETLEARKKEIKKELTKKR